MKMRWTTLSLATACLAGATLAQAGSFKRADDIAAQSLSAGMGNAKPLLLQRLAGNADATIAALQGAACKKACTSVRRETRADAQHLAGDGWQLDVFGDGSAAEFSDDHARARAHDLGVDAANAISADALESAGRAFIANRLAGVITLASNERLVAEATYARSEGGVDMKGQQAPERITGNRIVFTREIDGIPVVGNGSKVVITFLNDLSVESFRYDWPAYVIRGSGPAMAARDALLQRVQTVVGERANSPSTQAIGVQSNTTVDLGGGIALHRFECGYYDAGLANRDASAPVQAGCVYHAVHSIAGAMATRAGYSGAVPAAQTPAADARWPEAVLLFGHPSSQVEGDPGKSAAL